jgi:translation initiation factor 5B
LFQIYYLVPFVSPTIIMPKKKGGGKQKQQSASAADDDDDWNVINEAVAAAAVVDPPPKDVIEIVPVGVVGGGGKVGTDAGVDAAAAFLAAQGISDGGGAADKKKKKKKKKAGGGGGGEGGDDDVPTTPAVPPTKNDKISAKGRLIAERMRLQREEEERVRALEEAERLRVEEIMRREAEEEERIRLEKERKRLKEKEKRDRQKREGTYMTKKQKQQAAMAQQRLEAMRAAGMEVPSGGTTAGQRQQRPDYGNKKKSKAREKEVDYDDDDDDDNDDGDDYKEEEKKEKDEDEAEKKASEEEKASEVKEGDGPSAGRDKGKEDDDNDDGSKDEGSDSGDDWDADSDASGPAMDALEKRLMQANSSGGDSDHDDDEDLIEKEKRKELERLARLGKERAERERIQAIALAEMRAQEEEMARRELLLAQKREEGKKRRLAQEEANLAARTRDDLRCPVVVIMGHVDTGKTKLLDKIRKTNVQEGEAGGITQQIGATYFEKKTLLAQTARLNETEKFDLTLPGMLVIDTPGHESFTNLRSRGSSLCDVAILVVDLMHGLEQQTIESLHMLRNRGTPFVVALNKVDRCYDWKTCKDSPIRDALKVQPEGTIQEFRTRASDAKLQLQEQGVNSNIYWEMGEEDWENSDFVPLVPTSAITGEGVQDILLLLCQISQRKLWRRLMWCANLQCTVLEVKAIDGLGMTVDLLVVNGYLREGDKAVFCTLDGPIVTEIRGLLTPPPSREMRIKSEYIHHKEIKGALGVKVIGNGLEKVMAGTPVLVVGPDDEVEDIKAEVMSDLTKLQEKLSTDKKGVMVQASTLGALEALLQFLREDTKPPIPVSAIGIGTIHKRDVTKISIMNEKGCPEYATILAFDVPVPREAREHAEEVNVRIFTADIIYHLFDQFTRFMEELTVKRREDAAAVAVFPSICKILPQHIFNQKDPIIMGVEVVDGILKVGTPLCVPSLGGLHIGIVTSIEQNGREQDTAKKGTSVAIKIVNEHNPTITYGRQFDSSHSLYSTLSRASIDALKSHFKEKLEDDDWRLVVKLKKVFNII